MNLRLRCLIFTCFCIWIWGSASWPWLAFYVSLNLRSLIFTCVSTWTWWPPAWSTWTWCSAASSSCASTWTWSSADWNSFAFPHDLDAPCLIYMNLMLRCLSAAWLSLACFHMNLMLRCLIFTCKFLHELNAPLIDLHAYFLHELDALLLNLHLHFYMLYMNSMLRCLLRLHFNMNLRLPC